MKIVVPGGSGQVGQVLTRHFLAAGHEVVIIGRGAAPAQLGEQGVRFIVWDGKNLGDWQRELSGADAVINLAGRSVNCRYHARHRREILESRTRSTRIVGQAIARCADPPKVWLQMSTATIYADRYDADNDEGSGILGGSEANLPDTWRFSYDVAYAWERILDEAETPHTRKAKLRLAMLMSPDRGGTFDLLLRLARWGLGGRVASGRQYMSWIHDGDLCRAVEWLIAHEELTGAVNLAAPHPVPQADFMRELRAAWGRRIGLSATATMLEFATFLLRTESELILKSRRVVPGRLLDSGFRFSHSTWTSAAKDLCERWRCGKPAARTGDVSPSLLHLRSMHAR